MTEMPKPAIEIAGLNKWFGRFHVLRDIDLSVAAGERIVICGPSGSGKSTLVRCVNGLEEFQKGRVVIDGIELTPAALATVRREVGMVFQNFNLFAHLDVLHNCTLAPIEVRGLGRRAAEEQARHYLARVKMADAVAKYPAELSGGEQQRVAIARALCMRPKIMLFDEPTSALDPEAVNDVLDLIMALTTEEKMTMVCVTHEMGFARRIADRVVFMADGEIVEINAPQAFFSAPQHERTRLFLSQVLR